MSNNTNEKTEICQSGLQNKAKPESTICFIPETHFKYKNPSRMNTKRWRNILVYIDNTNKKEAEVAIPIKSDIKKERLYQVGQLWNAKGINSPRTRNSPIYLHLQPRWKYIRQKGNRTASRDK